MAMIVVERTRPGSWRYGLDSPAGPAWSGTVFDLEDGGRDATGPANLIPSVLLLVRLDPDAPTIRYDPHAVWAAAGRVIEAERRQQASLRGAGPWQRATTGLAKGQGRTLGEMAHDGRMGR